MADTGSPPPTRRPDDAYRPSPGDHFTFGLWTVGNRGRDPFGEPVRAPLAPADTVRLLADLGAYGVNLHDEDLVPRGAGAAERDRIVARFRRVLDETGMTVPMATTNLFSDPAFRDGAFTSLDGRVRALAVRKSMHAIDLGVELGAGTYVFWGGREGVETNAGKDPRDALARYRDALDYLCAYVVDQGYDLRFALEAKPNEPRGDIFLPTTGHALAFIETLERPQMVGVNPEVAHERMAGLDVSHGVAQALDAGKLFHIDLNDQQPGRFDQDLRFGSADPKGAFFLVKLLEDAAWEGMRHFDSHAYRSEDAEGVRAFAAGSMRTYLILREKVARFHQDAEIQALLEELRGRGAGHAPGPYDPEGAAALKARRPEELDAAPDRGLGYERLDQLTMELLLGVR